MTRAAPAVLLFGNTPVVTSQSDDPARLLQALADLWVEATELAKDVQRVEDRVQVQADWLAANPDHPRYGERVLRAWEVRREQERLNRREHDLAKEANKLVERMGPETHEQARRDIHEWSAIGGVGIQAKVWGLAPDPAWLAEDDEEGRE